jgi:FkbM family methyltransferase
MLSFAQNLEDVCLWHCLGGRPKGFYVDVGASSPIRDSVTHLFYEAGWNGINVEPIPERAAELRRLRPRDVIVSAALGSKPGAARLVRTSGIGGLSTLTPPDQLPSEYQGHFWTIEVPRITLTAILEEHRAERIDFLKIDAEGAEFEVLRGLDFDRWRPEVLLLEAVAPKTADRTDGAWSELLEDQGYALFHFDQLNAFYCAKERRGEMSERAASLPQVMRFSEMGHPLIAPDHPEHRFAVHLAHSLMSAGGIEQDEYLEAVFCLDRSPEELSAPVTEQTARQAHQAVFGKAPSETEMRVAMEHPGRTMRELIQALIASERFRLLRAKSMGG